jgi:hypothetical protein
MVAPRLVLLLRPVEEPELAGNGARVEEIARISIITSTAPVSTSFWRTVASSRPALDACEDMTTPARPVSIK